MKKYIGTIITVIVVLALVVLNLVFSGYQLTETQKNALITVLIICGGSALYCFVVGEISRNNSQMDKIGRAHV